MQYSILRCAVSMKEAATVWEKYMVKTTTGIGVEAVTAVLLANGITGMEIIDGTERKSDLQSLVGTWDYADESLLMESDEACVVFYVPKCEDNTTILANISSGLRKIGHKLTKADDAIEDEWLHEWRKHFKTLKIGNVVVVPAWESHVATDGEVVFTIEPGTAFGTGQHESTELCILALQEYVKQGDSVLDIGCGSGILSCISSLLGAKKVLACDIDPLGAIRATKANASLNNIDNIEVFAGNALTCLKDRLLSDKYDVVVSNIVAEVVIKLAPLAKRLLNPGGIYISSGILNSWASEVRDSLTSEGFEIRWEKELGGWTAFAAKARA